MKDTETTSSANGAKKRLLQRNGQEMKYRDTVSHSSDSTHNHMRRGDQGVGRRVRSHHMSTLFLMFIVITIPLSFIYLGYYIGTLFMPPPPRIPAPGIVMDMALLNYSWYNTHNLTIAFAGGLGNQMFQYASMYGISKANGFKPIMCTGTLVGRHFRMLKARRTDDEMAMLAKSYGIYADRKSNAFDKSALSLNFMRNIILDGFFQSWRYFDHVRSDIRKQFQFRASTISTVDSFLRESAVLAAGFNEPTFVGVHIRRGDLFDTQNVRYGYTVADSSYLQRAMRYFEKKHERVVFVVSSDDMFWSAANVNVTRAGSAVVFSRFSSLSPDVDLALQSHCNHSIITVGTFGWWAAWLADGETIYYRDYPKQDSKLRDNFRFSDYYLPKWIAM